MGVTTQAAIAQPFLLFREKDGNAVIPLELHAIDAAVAIAEMDQELVSPHDLAIQVLQAAGIRPSRCVFLEAPGRTNYLELSFANRKYKPMRFPAEFAMSFCLRAKVRFFCSRKFLEGNRDLQVEAERSAELEQMQRPRYLN